MTSHSLARKANDPLTTYAYDAGGNLTSRTDFNGKVTTYTYDAVNRLLTKTPDPSFGAPQVRFTYNPTGTRASMVDASGTTTYLYSSRDRLTSKTTPQGSVGYGYDLAGNLTRIQVGSLFVNYSYDVLNRLSTASETNTGTTSYTYDANGNLATVTQPNGVTHAYTYNTRNQLTNLGVGAPLAAPIASYTYALDATGRRTSVAELSGRTVSYAYDALYRLTGETITGDPGPTPQNGTISYTYDAFGNLISRTGATPNHYLYAGAQFDEDLNLYYNRARYLDVRSGRFWSMDTFEGNTFDPPSLHKYLYAGGNPTNRVDPSGRFYLPDAILTGAIVGALSGAIVGGITGGWQGAINGALEGAALGAVFTLGGGVVGAAIGNLARGVFLVGVGGLIGSGAVNTYSLVTAEHAEERKAAATALLVTVAFVYFGPRVLQYTQTSTTPAEIVNEPFLRSGGQAPYQQSTVVADTTFFTPMRLVRVYSGGRQIGVWLARAEDVQGLTPLQIQAKLGLPEVPTHITDVAVPAGTDIRVGYTSDAFGGTPGTLQYQILEPGQVPNSAFRNARPLVGPRTRE